MSKKLTFTRSINRAWGMDATPKGNHVYILPKATDVVIDGRFTFDEIEQIYLKMKEVKENDGHEPKAAHGG